ncbi:septum-promoting GTP-binding protein 1 [Tripterygium wilfordii]|uniref:Septum-promoting GTP-binding protein 1 n=1 Tax=Tripterygium wilfordii TaxID=458696 RepID=A0A7J7C2Q2_TRIWF|nr:septum-promoting GTP-binding protein 1 [Tripterygium wilfordii]
MMTQICKKLEQVKIRWSLVEEKVSIFRQFFQFIWDRILSCSIGKQRKYRRLAHRQSPEPIEAALEDQEAATTTSGSGYDSDSDLVPLKISILGDCQTGKTTFVIKYVGDEQEKKCLQMGGLNLMDKTLFVQGARISFSIWDVGGDSMALDHVPIACKDAVAILFMFDLTSRCTLNSVIGWYSQARKWNQTAIPILIGTKFDDFVKLPPDLQWTIVTQVIIFLDNKYCIVKVTSLNRLVFWVNTILNPDLWSVHQRLDNEVNNLP